MEFQEKFIAFVDILGFKDLVAAAEAGTGMPLSDLLELLNQFGPRKDVERIRKRGPHVCPQSKYLQRDLNFELTQMSDSIVVSSEISPAGVMNLVSYCWTSVLNLLQSGIMCRGYISKGKIYHTQDQVIGTGYQEAYSKEGQVKAFKRKADERGTPFVEVDPFICDYVNNCGDSCVRKMFGRMVKGDGEVTALFPFQRLRHSFIVWRSGRMCDPEKQRRSNHNMRLLIKEWKSRIMKFVDKSNPSAVIKAEHYIAALDAQLAICDKTDEFIDLLGSKM